MPLPLCCFVLFVLPTRVPAVSLILQNSHFQGNWVTKKYVSVFRWAPAYAVAV